jgi:hypothetical protein
LNSYDPVNQDKIISLIKTLKDPELKLYTYLQLSFKAMEKGSKDEALAIAIDAPDSIEKQSHLTFLDVTEALLNNDIKTAKKLIEQFPASRKDEALHFINHKEWPIPPFGWKRADFTSG